ncbi:extracellular solute-binding protein [Brachybacterium sp. J153]|uniref:extracellular solute-binding protein n=1 Tax=Brachybacterium sp. J153 TaxID=3116488 RepID=UPI002E75E4A5|nr:extracellular solute-binding protein [Brachybacterium sp. J153]MEE1617717.1 extracellular solute-binding protein [Brachybacterium sp. J153]
MTPTFPRPGTPAPGSIPIPGGTTAGSSPTRPSPAGPTRRTLLKGLGGIGALGAAGSLAACSGASARGTEDIAYWHLLSGPDGVTMSELIDGYMATDGAARVQQTVLGWGAPYYTKLAMASAGGRAPDLAVMHAARVPGYAPGGLLDEWDLDLLGEFGVHQEDFPELIWEKMVVDGKLTCIALDSHPFVLYYNTEIAEAAGVLGSDGLLLPTDTPEDFRALALELGAKAPSGYGLSWGYLGDGSNQWRMFSTYYTQLGGTIDLPVGGTMGYQEELVVEAIEWILSLIDGEVGNPGHDGGTAISEFATGGSGAFYGGVWETGSYKNEGLPFDMTVIPGVFGEPTAYADSHSFVLPHQSSPDPERRRAVHGLVAHLLKSSLAWAGAGHIPAYTPVIEDPGYADLVPQSHYADAIDHLVYDPPAWFTGSGSDFHTYFGNDMQNVWARRTDPLEGWNAFVARINDLLAKPSPM